MENEGNELVVSNRNEAENENQYESDEDENYYENPLEVIREFGNNPLMERAQKALTKQLKDIYNRLKVERYEKNEELKRYTQEREELGVQLYSLQQQLARVQIVLENSHNEYNVLVDSRLQEEEILKNVVKNNLEQKSLEEEYRKQYKKYSAELDALNETIRQIENYNEEIKSEIAITRRATHKAEQSMQNLEKYKESQDSYVDGINKQVRQLKDQILLYIQQLDSQKQDTADANSVLQDTIRELELISTEKKHIMTQWKAALSGLSRRDEALAQALLTLATAESAVHDYDVEIEATRRDLKREQVKHESLVNLRDRLENELQWVEENLTKIRQEREQLQERYTLLNKSLNQTDGEVKKLETISKQLLAETDSLIQNLQVVTEERQKMEEELQLSHSTQSNVNKAVTNLQKEQMKVLKKIHEKENECSEVENEIARITVERLNLTAANDQLKDQLSIINKEVKEKEALISKYQLEIRQRNDEVEKKMYRVDRLNKKYEKMVESVGGEENLGPLENTIKNLQKEIDNVTIENKELEREWLKRQTDMVSISSECDQMTEKNNEQQSRLTILTQQQMRLLRNMRDLRNNLKVSKQVNVDLQKDVSKLNTLISVNHDQESQLQGSNYTIEKECVEELKDAEKECLSLQTNITETKSNKAGLIDEILDMERQALLWEKKIQLDKETRAALDPTVGVQETETMEKEIHRMQLRYEALRREQERLSIEMERAINKRATIAVRYGKNTKLSSTESSMSLKSSLKSTSKNSSKGDLTQAEAKKKIMILKKEARGLAEESSRYTTLYEQKKGELAAINLELETVTVEYSDSEETCHHLQTQINDLLYQKQLQQERMSYKQKYASRLKELSASGGNAESSQALQVERRVLAASQALDNVKEIIADLQSSFPHLKEVLMRVDAMTDPNIEELDEIGQ